MIFKPSILLVEDDPDISMVLSSFMEENQFDVTCVGDGRDAIAMVETSLFDLIVLDVMMPNLDGISYLKWLREVRVSNVPVIIYSGVVDPEHLRTLNEYGASRIVEKPVHPDKLIQIINDCLIDHEETLVNKTISKMSA